MIVQKNRLNTAESVPAEERVMLAATFKVKLKTGKGFEWYGDKIEVKNNVGSPLQYTAATFDGDDQSKTVNMAATSTRIENGKTFAKFKLKLVSDTPTNSAFAVNPIFVTSSTKTIEREAYDVNRVDIDLSKVWPNFWPVNSQNL